MTKPKAKTTAAPAPARGYAAHDWTPDTPAKWQDRGPDGRLSERPRRGPDGRLIGW